MPCSIPQCAGAGRPENAGPGNSETEVYPVERCNHQKQCMGESMNLSELLTELGCKINIDDLALDENNICRLVFDDRIVIDMESLEEEEALFIYTPICRIPSKGELKFYKNMLSANAFCRETGNGFLSLDTESDTIMLQEKIIYDGLSFTAFFNRFEIFVVCAEKWKNRVETADFFQSGDSDNDLSSEKNRAENISSLELMSKNFIRV